MKVRIPFFPYVGHREKEMGRGKLNMELIRKEKSRNTTFKKRKEGLLRKIHEFTTLCDVSACMIIYGPKQEATEVEPEVWPENQEEVRQLIDIYRSKSRDSGSCRVYGLGDFFDDRKKRMEDELEKLRKKNTESKFPTWIDFLSFFSEMQLRSLASGLSHKIEIVKNRIESIKRSDDHHQQDQNLDMMMMMMMTSKSHPFPPGLIQRGIELDLMNQQQQQQQSVSEVIPYQTIDQEQQLHSINQNSMMMMLMDDNDRHHQMQIGGANGCNIQRAAFKRQIYFESTAGVIDDNTVYNNHTYNNNNNNPNPRSLTRYYAPTLLQPPFVRCPVSTDALPPPQMHSSQEDIQGNEFAHNYGLEGCL